MICRIRRVIAPRSGKAGFCGCSGMQANFGGDFSLGEFSDDAVGSRRKGELGAAPRPGLS